MLEKIPCRVALEYGLQDFFALLSGLMCIINVSQISMGLLL